MVSEQPDGGRGALSQHVGHLVQTETGYLLPIHLQDLISNRQQASVQLLSAAVHHVLHVDTYSTHEKQCDAVLIQNAGLVSSFLGKTTLIPGDPESSNL